MNVQIKIQSAAGIPTEWPVKYACMDIAVRLAQTGRQIFPCNPRTKAPMLRGNWKNLASDDPTLIQSWWQQTPNAMIGLPTGRKLNAFVLDLDVTDTLTLADLRSKVEDVIKSPLPQTWTVNTPRGGQHIYFAMPDDITLGNARGRLPKHIDVRGEGGYVIAAGSVRYDGKHYGWDLSPDRTPLAEAPDRLISCLTR